MDFIIRQVEEDDLKEVAELCVKDWKYAYKGFIDDEYLDNLDTNEKYERMKSNYKEGHFIVAESNGRIVGFCRYSDDYIDNPDDDEKDCELNVLYVNWEDRGNGIGSALVDFVKNYFRSIGRKKMLIWCFKENEKGRRFYEKMGGKIFGQKIVDKNGQKLEEVGFEYELL
ncbi:MAG: GNAT family N-acetyltransferase [Clostridia bacterium]|nr:GNAT family N-acetyltransferase [Clostridia bacterium]